MCEGNVGVKAKAAYPRAVLSRMWTSGLCIGHCPGSGWQVQNVCSLAILFLKTLPVPIQGAIAT